MILALITKQVIQGLISIKDSGVVFMLRMHGRLIVAKHRHKSRFKTMGRVLLVFMRSTCNGFVSLAAVDCKTAISFRLDSAEN